MKSLIGFAVVKLMKNRLIIKGKNMSCAGVLYLRDTEYRSGTLLKASS